MALLAMQIQSCYRLTKTVKINKNIESNPCSLGIFHVGYYLKHMNI